MKKPQATQALSVRSKQKAVSASEKKSAAPRQRQARNRESRRDASTITTLPAVKNKRAKGLLSPTQKVRARERDAITAETSSEPMHSALTKQRAIRRQTTSNHLRAKRQAKVISPSNPPTPAVKDPHAKERLPKQQLVAQAIASMRAKGRVQPAPQQQKQHAISRLSPNDPARAAKRQATIAQPIAKPPALNRADQYQFGNQLDDVGTERQANKGTPPVITLPAAEPDFTDQATSDFPELSVGEKKRDEVDEASSTLSPKYTMPRRVKRPRAGSTPSPRAALPVDTEPHADKPELSTDELRVVEEQAMNALSPSQMVPAVEPSADPPLTPVGNALAVLKKLAVVHAHLTKAITRDINHVKAVARSIADKEQADYIQTLLMERAKLLKPHKEQNARYIERTIRQMPIHEWVAGIPGAGMVNVGLILGHTGDPAQYANPAKIWKRMGLGIMPDGQRQRRFTDPELALIAGYSPRRRSVMWILGDCLLRQNYNDAAHEEPGYYRALFEERFIYELAKLGVERDAYDAKIKNHTHAKSKAKRYMEKRFLLHLWRQFRPHHTEAHNDPNRTN